MINWINERLRKEEGFTLIELMVVVLIIAILIAIAIPTFLGARRRAQDRGAQSNLRNALTAEKVYYADKQVYTDDTTELNKIETSLTFKTSGTALAKDREVLVAKGANTAGVADQVVCISTQSASGTTFSIADVASGATATTGTYFLTGTYTACTEVGVSGQTGSSRGGW